MLNEDVDNVDSVMSASGVWSHKRESWYRIKKELAELPKTPTNTTKAKISALVAGWDAALADKKLQQAEYMAEEMRKLYRRFD